MASSEFTLTRQVKSDRRSPIRWILSHVKRQWYIILTALVGAVSNALLAAYASIFIGMALNDLLAVPPELKHLGQLALLIGLFHLARGFLQFIRNFGFEVTAQRVERDIRDELYTSLLGKSMTFHNLQPLGDTMARATNDVREVNFMFAPGLMMVVGSLNFLFMPIILSPRYHISLIAAPLLFLITYIFALRGYLRELKPVTDDVRTSFGDLNTRLSEALDGIETVKGSAQEHAEVGKFRLKADRYRAAIIRQGNIEARFIPLLLYVVCLAGGLLHALLLFRQGLLNTGDVVGYFGLLLMLDFPTFSSLFAYSTISSGMAGARRILELINRENNLDQNLAGRDAAVSGEIEFRNVSFAYDGNEPVLKNISFKVKPGQTVAIVGQTGSGKTTLARLVNRTYDATRGQVLVDGVDVRGWRLENLRRGTSIIEQDIFLFSDTIYRNISFGKPDALQEEVEKAAAASQSSEFIQSFQNGYQTILGERGITLSGGQRQRLALARAFLTDPRILILDDSTSAIDSATEDLIQRAIYSASRGRTTLIITHRLSQIRWADLILVLRRGELAAAGTHEELMQSSPAYREIFSE